MSRDQHRKSPSGININNLTLYDKDGVAYVVNSLQAVAIKVSADQDDSENAILDGRAQYYTKGDVTALESETATQLNLCQTAESLSGDTTKFDLSNVASAGQFLLMGVRVTLVERETVGGALSYVKLDDLVFGITVDDGDGSEFYITTTQGVSDGPDDSATVTLTGVDSAVSYSVDLDGSLGENGYMQVEITAPTSTETLTAYAELFVYEAKDI